MIKQYFSEEILFDHNFGMKGSNIGHVKYEKKQSKYIRYLIKKGKIIQWMDRGLLLDVDYDGIQNKAYCKFYDLDTYEIRIWLDVFNHEPYCLVKKTKEQLLENQELLGFQGFKKFEMVKKYDLINDCEIEMGKIYANNPSNIKNDSKYVSCFKKIFTKEIWEGNIQYHHNYISDIGLIPGMIYKINDGVPVLLNEMDDTSRELQQQFLDIFKNDKSAFYEYAKNNVNIFLNTIPEVNKTAIDIETEIGPNKAVPNPKEAKQKVISISFYDRNKSIVYILDRDGFEFNSIHEKFPQFGEIYFFKTEEDLLIQSFKLMWRFPIIVTFNGDNFDLSYLYYRAKRLKIDDDLIPIQVKKGFGLFSQYDCTLVNGIHVDVYNFFSNKAIKGYAFQNAYDRNGLNDISKALLKSEKYQHEEEIDSMDYGTLAWYNLKDSILTHDLLCYNDNIVWYLMMIVCRISKLGISEMHRRQISAWVRNLLYFDHRQRNCLIPRRSDLEEKKGGFSKAIIDGKQFQGAFVLKPKKGIWYDVVVLDFASLYPSIIKEYNLSYETIQCHHEECKDNIFERIPFHVCNKNTGIGSVMVGFLRDIRVNFFKPLSNDKSISKEKKSFFTIIQQAIKVFMNSSYGIFGSNNFALFCLPVAEAVASLGRKANMGAIEKAKIEGVESIYSDTDSTFLKNPTDEQVNNLIDWAKKELSLDLEKEKTFQFLALTDRKKNYVGIYKDSLKVEMKGLMAKKKNTPQFMKNSFNRVVEVLKKIKNDEDFKKARSYIIKLIKNTFHKIGKDFPIEDYAVHLVLQKDLKSYKDTIPQHVKLAKESGKAYRKGDVVSFIKSNGKSGAKLVEKASHIDINVKKYRELLKSTFEQLLDALDISWSEINAPRVKQFF